MLKEIPNGNGITIEASLKEMRNYRSAKQKMLVCGHIYHSNRIPFLYHAIENIENLEMIVLCENGNTNYHDVKQTVYPTMNREQIKKIRFFIVPDMFIKDYFHEFLKLPASLPMKINILSKYFLREAVKNLKKRHWNMGKGYAETFACEAEYYINEMLDILKPDIVVIWNQFHAFHHILEGICRKRKIKCVYFEFGVLPGTYALETMGQMGESYPAKHYKEFMELTVNENELLKAGEIWDYLETSKLNRKEQPVNDELDILKMKLDDKRPTVFYAGQNDFESGLYPYTRNTKKNHSPIFGSSDEAAVYIAKICYKNKWNFIYKRHPLVSKFMKKSRLPENVLLFDQVDISQVIELADVTLTILSQVGYVATILKKPTVMLGYMQLRGKGCTYEAFCKRDIEITIKQALQNGFTKEQERAFLVHIAQLNRYYLFNDPFVERNIYYGQEQKACETFFRQALEQKALEKNREYKKYGICQLTVDLLKAVKGRFLWRKIYDSGQIDLGKEHIIVIPEEEIIEMYYGMLYIENYLKQISKSNCTIITDSRIICDTIPLFTKKAKRIVYITHEKMNALLKYYAVFGEQKIATVVSLERLTGRLSKGLINKEGITVEELVAVGIYDLSYLFLVQNFRKRDLEKSYLEMYFPMIDGRGSVMDLSDMIQFEKDMLTKRGISRLTVHENLANLSIYANRVSGRLNAVGLRIPSGYAPAKDIVTTAHSPCGKVYIVIVKNNGEVWFNFSDEKKESVIVLNTTWITN